VQVFGSELLGPAVLTHTHTYESTDDHGYVGERPQKWVGECLELFGDDHGDDWNKLSPWFVAEVDRSSTDGHFF
jgi:hypothetical protein